MKSEKSLKGAPECAKFVPGVAGSCRGNDGKGRGGNEKLSNFLFGVGRRIGVIHGLKKKSLLSLAVIYSMKGINSYRNTYSNNGNFRQRGDNLMEVFTLEQARSIGGMNMPSGTPTVPRIESLKEIAWWFERGLIPSVLMNGINGYFIDMYDDAFIDGFWYMPTDGTEKEREAMAEAKAAPMRRLLHDLQNPTDAMEPYLKANPRSTGLPLLDPWYLVSTYDAVSLLYATVGLLDTLMERAKCQVISYPDLFYNLKSEIISGGVHVALGREQVLNAYAEGPDDLEAHIKVIIDRSDFYQFLVEKSGISLSLLPGSIIATYEREIQSLKFRKRGVTPPIPPEAMNEHSILLNELIKYAERLNNKPLSRGTVLNALARRDVKPLSQVKVGKTRCNVYPKQDAKEAVEAWLAKK